MAISADILTAMTEPENVVNQDNLAYAREFKDKMQYEAFKDASLGYNLGKAEIQQINPTFVTLDDKYGEKRSTGFKKPNEKAIEDLKANPSEDNKNSLIKHFGLEAYKQVMGE